jgi:hypothetical protein
MNYISKIARNHDYPQVLRSGPSSLPAADRLARNLGWFSIALGVVELVGAERIAGALGMRGKEGLIRTFGMREIGSGMLSLSIDKKAGLWSRVAGDGLDIATLAAGLHPGNRKRRNVGLALTMVLGVTLLDIFAAQAVGVRHARKEGRAGSRPVRDYSDRSGFPQGLAAARGVARNRIDRPSGLRAAS